MSVEKHLLRYFELHGSSQPPPGLYSRILKEIEYPLVNVVARVEQNGAKIDKEKLADHSRELGLSLIHI